MSSTASGVDVGTISSYHETSMDLLGPDPEFDIYSHDFPIMSKRLHEAARVLR